MRKNFKWLLLALAACAVGGTFFSGFLLANARGGNVEAECYSNLKNIGTALEMYSADWSGKYPKSLYALTPNYLKQLPVCPIGGYMSYQMVTGPGVGYNKGGVVKDGTKRKPFQDYYLVWCEGQEHHRVLDSPVNYPQYDAISGLIVR